VLQKLVTSVGTNLGKGPYPVSGCEIWQQVFLKLPERKAGWFPAGRRSGNYENRADPDATTARATRAAAFTPERCIPDYQRTASRPAEAANYLRPRPGFQCLVRAGPGISARRS
jgi:hypothetical protein